MKQITSDIMLITLLMNQLTLYSRKYLKSTRPFYMDYNSVFAFVQKTSNNSLGRIQT